MDNLVDISIAISQFLQNKKKFGSKITQLRNSFVLSAVLITSLMSNEQNLALDH